jgi:predicted amidohydrolase
MLVSSPSKVLVGVAQMCSTSNKALNLSAISRLAATAALSKAKMLFLPECFASLGSSPAETLSLCEAVPPVGSPPPPLLASSSDDADSPFPTTTFLQRLAREHDLWISGGGFHESGAPPGSSGHPRVYNTHLIIDNGGTLRAKYRKVHLFDVEIPEKGVSLKESATTAPGDEYVVVENTPVGTLGLATCYDVRFPEQASSLAFELGANVLLYPSAFTVPTGRAHWELLLRARAAETQCYVFAAAQVGRHNEKRASYGHALAVDPWGKVLADAGGYGPIEGLTDEERKREDMDVEAVKEKVVFCEIDLDRLAEVRRNMPIKNHRRAVGRSVVEGK